MENKIVLSLKDTNQYFEKTELKMFGYDNGTLIIELATLNEHRICQYSMEKETFKKVGSNVKQIKTVNEFLAAFKLIFENSVKDVETDQLVEIENNSSTTMLFMGMTIWAKAIMLAAKMYPDKMQSFITTWHDNLVNNSQDSNEKNTLEKVYEKFKKSKKETEQMRLSAMTAETDAIRIKEFENSIYEIDNEKNMFYYDGNPFDKTFRNLFDTLIKQKSFEKDESGFLQDTYFECLQLMNDLEWLYKKHDSFFCEAWCKFLGNTVNLIELVKSTTNKKSVKRTLNSFAFEVYGGVEKLSDKFDEELKLAEEKVPTWFNKDSEFYKDWANDLVEEIRNEAVEA